MAIRPDVEELRGTLGRMQAQWLVEPELKLTYERLVRRFESDLADERDQLLSKCATLMLIKFMAEDRDAG